MTREFNVGDKVVVREWDDMEREFGLTVGGSINCKCTFVPAMINLCGREFVITKIENEKTVYGHDFSCFISVDMIKLVEEGTEIEFDNTEVNKFLDEFHVS